jgi:predicted adenylyl cyclase CyaB
MAYDQIEVEVKVRLEPDTYPKVRNNVLAIAKFVSKVVQRDTYFIPNHENYMDAEFPYKWLSIRERSGKTILNFKHFYPEGAEKHSYCDEYEVVIGDSAPLKQIFKELGIREIVDVQKTREVFRVKDNFEIAMDQVRGLGDFIEIEALEDMGGVEETRRQLEKVAESLGVGLDHNSGHLTGGL